MPDAQIHQHECTDCGDSFNCIDPECEVDSLLNGQPSLCPDCDPDDTDDLDDDDFDDLYDDSVD